MLWHFLLESLGYFVAFRLYLSERRKEGDFLPSETRWTIIVAALLGAAAGSRIFFWFEDPSRTMHQWHNLAYLIGGKTIIGALLGGTMAVEVTKSRLGITARTGDLFAIPIAAGIAIGRLGCFFAGTPDGTFGISTTLPWGVNFGDGIYRHPVQLYESAAMLPLIYVLAQIRPPRFERGDRFRIFLLAYFGWRLVIDFLKPSVTFAGLGTLQWACVAALLWYASDLRRLLFTHSRVEARANG
ncbi:MAG: prolipoprotein diacylglyceryl transferase family protein [Bryobacteraceae bacterium]